jgi:hypothetical protein
MLLVPRSVAIVLNPVGSSVVCAALQVVLLVALVAAAPDQFVSVQLR